MGTKRVVKRRTNDALVPLATDAERATLGAILTDGRQYVPVARVVKAGHFHRPVHALIFETMTDLHRAGSSIDFVTIGQALSGSDELREAGGLPYIAGLAERVPVAAHARHYAEQVYRAAMRRNLIGAAGELARTAYDDDEKFDDLMPKARAILDQIDDHAQHSETGSVDDALLDLIEERPSGWPTGVPTLDDMLGGAGLVPGKLLVITGRSGAGKTWIATGMLVSAIDSGARVCDFTLEMSRSSRVARMGAAKFGPDALRLTRPPGTWTNDDHALYARIAAWLDRKPVRIFERQYDVHSITTLARMHEAEVVLVDYYQNLRRPPEASRMGADDVDRVLSEELESLVRLTGCCLVVVSQLNKDGGMKYGSWLNTKCDAHLSMVETETSSGLPAVRIEPEKNRWAPDARAGIEQTYIMDKTRGRLLPVDDHAHEPAGMTHASASALTYGD